MIRTLCTFSTSHITTWTSCISRSSNYPNTVILSVVTLNPSAVQETPVTTVTDLVVQSQPPPPLPLDELELELDPEPDGDDPEELEPLELEPLELDELLEL